MVALTQMEEATRTSLWKTLSAAANLSGRFISGARGSVVLGDLLHRSSLCGRLEELRGRSLLIATASQLTAALALIELDGVARRLVLCPPDLPPEHLPFVLESASVDAIVTDAGPIGDVPTVGCFVTGRLKPRATDGNQGAPCQTEWLLLTSGTTGRPKIVCHTLETLAGGIEGAGPLAGGFVWSTFYDIRRYGGLQIFLRAILGGGSMVLSDAEESPADFLSRAGARGVTHISGTPSHWRRAIMSSAAHQMAPRYVRLSGEIADQAILDNLHSIYPDAQIAHAFASTEAGLAFDVRDGLAGIPASLIEHGNGKVELKIEDGSLRIRSARTAVRYVGPQTLADADGFVDTGDMLELRADRYYFVGRRDGVINVGGQKVHPEEVESVINRHPRVRMSMVRMKKNAITGGLVVADVVLESSSTPLNGEGAKLEQEILQLCRGVLPRHKVPAVISFTAELPVGPSGKLVRHRA